jgi:hypothetical protein
MPAASGPLIECASRQKRDDNPNNDHLFIVRRSRLLRNLCAWSQRPRGSTVSIGGCGGRGAAVGTGGCGSGPGGPAPDVVTTVASAPVAQPALTRADRAPGSRPLGTRTAVCPSGVAAFWCSLAALAQFVRTGPVGHIIVSGVGRAVFRLHP